MWVAIFAWGVGGTLLNFAMLVTLLTVLDGGWLGIGGAVQAGLDCAGAARDTGHEPALLQRPRMLWWCPRLPTPALHTCPAAAPKDAVVVSEEAFAAQLAARGSQGSLEASTGGAAVKVDMGKLDSGSGHGTAGTAAAEGGKHDLESQQGERAGQGGSALTFRPLVMTFRDVRYSVPFPKVRQRSWGGRAGGLGVPAGQAAEEEIAASSGGLSHSSAQRCQPAAASQRAAPPCPSQDMVRPEGGGGGGGEGPHAGRLLLLKGITGSFRPGVRGKGERGVAPGSAACAATLGDDDANALCLLPLAGPVVSWRQLNRPLCMPNPPCQVLTALMGASGAGKTVGAPQGRAGGQGSCQGPGMHNLHFTRACAAHHLAGAARPAVVLIYSPQ